MTQRDTALVLLTALVALLAYDLWVLLRRGATISQTVNGLSKTSPVIPFLMGLAVGHCVWPIYREEADG